MLKGIEVLCHSSIKMKKGKTIYIDPFRIEKNYFDADVIFITHDHYDHFSEEDIEKIRKEDTIIILPENMLDKVNHLQLINSNVIRVQPNKEYEISGIKFSTVPAYNVNKAFHPKENNWVGYIIEIDGTRYYIAGDTDVTEENLKIQCDVALLPIGGTYTMTYEEAAKLANQIQPKIVVPTHYGCIVGEKEDASQFKKLIDEKIECHILIK